jgi:hypothetical protein
VSLSCHRWSQWSTRLGGVEKAFPARKVFPWYSLIMVDIHGVLKAS